jgi:ribonuclease HI
VVKAARASAPKWRKGRRDSLKNCWGATPVSVRIRPSAPKDGIVPGCVVVAQRTLDPLAQVRILARQPTKIGKEVIGLRPQCQNKTKMEKLKRVTIYTDGACLGNPGPGGYGAILLYQGHKKEMSGGYRQTTNNRMEIMAAIIGLEALRERCLVTLYSDSEYLVKAMSRGWAQRWRARGWKRNKREKVLNPDLWERLLQLCEHHKVQFGWVKAHAGTAENMRCDELAIQAAQQPNLPDDSWYISQSKIRQTV